MPRSELIGIWTPQIPVPATNKNECSAEGTVVWESMKAHKLYPDIAILRAVPLGIGNSVYTLPEVPTIGFMRGRMSSSIGVRNILIMMERTLKISYTRSQLCFVLSYRCKLMNLGNGRQIRHPLEITGCEVSVTSRSDLSQSVVDLCTQFLLKIMTLGQLPEAEGQLENL